MHSRKCKQNKKSIWKGSSLFTGEWYKLINRSVVSCSEKEKLNILWIGTMEARKMPNIVLDVVLKMKEVSHVVFHMIGGGPLLPWFRNSIQNMVLKQIL